VLVKILFWLLIGIDTIVLGAIFLLGLGFTGSSQVYTARHVNHFALPVGLLLVSAALFVLAKSPALRGIAFLLALSPVLVLYVTYASKGTPHDPALENAIRADDLEAVHAALRIVDVNKPGSDGVDPLTMAMDKFLETNNAAVIRELLAAGANPNGNSERAVSPLRRAIEMTKHHGTEPMMLLLKAGAKPNAKTGSDDPAFFAAAQKGIDVSVMQTLVEHGADLRMENGQGKNVLDRAVFDENQPVVEYLTGKGVQRKADTGGAVR
jgi:ankyrin repeat protein